MINYLVAKYKIKTENAIYWVIGCFLLMLVANEAYIIPLTHDELSTIDISQNTIFEIISYADPIPNNHILNTLLLKLNIAIFGEHLFTDRLHNVLSFIPFFIFTILLAKLLFKDNWLRMAFVCLIILQPFLLDFYTVTRGYGLSVAFQMVSLFYFFKRIKYNEGRYLTYAILFAAIGVYANFTLLNYYIPLGFLLGVHTILTYKKEGKEKVFKAIGVLTLVSLFLGALCYLPFFKMMSTKQFVYWGTTSFLTDTVKQLIISLRSGVEYFNWSNEIVYMLVLSFISLVILLGIIFYKKQQNARIFIYALGLLLLVILYNNMQFYLVQVPFLHARTALFFLPMVSICVCLGMDAVTQRNRLAGLLMTIFTISFSLQHFIRGFNNSLVFEWYYDANTHEVLRDIDELIKNENLNTPVKLDCYWIFHPSLSYHISHKYKGVIELIPYHKELEINEEARYYYIQSDQQEQLTQKFEKIKDYSSGNRVLMKAK